MKAPLIDTLRSSPYALLPYQASMLKTLAKTGKKALLQPFSNKVPPTVPGPTYARQLSPLPSALIDGYLAFIGGDRDAWDGLLPPFLFPQWVLPTMAETLFRLPYPVDRIVNGGATLKILAPIRRDEALLVRAQLKEVIEHERHIVLVQHAETGTLSHPHALDIEVRAILRKAEKKSKPKGEKREKARIPEEASLLSQKFLRKDTGLDYAFVTGDFNPIHWLPLAARLSGFRNVILHGFATMAYAGEALLEGRPHLESRFDVRFEKPLVLPTGRQEKKRISIFRLGEEVFLGDAKGEEAYMTGTFRES